VLDTAGEIVRRNQELEQQRSSFLSQWTDISENILGRGDFQTLTTSLLQNQGIKKTRKLYDTTARKRGRDLAGNLGSLITPPTVRFVGLQTHPAEMRGFFAIDSWLDFAENWMLRVFQRRRGGWLQASQPTYEDVVFYGTGAMFTQAQLGFGPKFQSRPLSELTIDVGPDGFVDTVFRKYALRTRSFRQEFGEGADPEMDRLWESGEDRPIEILHLVHPRSESGVLNSRPWRSVHVRSDKPRILRESGYWTFPWAIPRWAIDTGNVFGTGPGMDVLSDALGANAMARDLLIASNKAVMPPMGIPDDGIVGPVSFAPNSFTTYRAGMFQSNPFHPIHEVGQYPFSIDMLQDKRRQIIEGMYGDLLVAANASGTATEFIGSEEKLAEKAGPMVGRVAAELVESTVVRILDIGERMGLLPPRPPELQGVLVTVKYESPIVRVQRRREARGIMGTYEAYGAMATVNPEVFDNIDPDAAARAIADASIIPPSVMRSEQEVGAIREERARAQAIADASAEAQAAAQALGQAGGAAQSVAAAVNLQ
jgi:hypothetical protein